MRFQNLVFATIASACLSTAATVIAAAADPYYKARPGGFIVPYSWNGIYGGLSGGYGWGKTRGNFLPAGFGPSLDLDGGMVGGQIGYNYQIGNWVIGFEIDYQWTEVNGSGSSAGTRAEAEIRSFGTARGRLGTAWDRFLIFGTGGGAWGRGIAVIPGFTSDAANHTGWTVGGGLEFGLTPNLSAKAEYLYVRFNTKDYFVSQGCTVTCELGAGVNVVRAGLNYRFDWSVLP
ncbi:MAG TPA: outer membrane beta-barrel protein [Xanthobacteraceae bacterium]|nr:outer membrane beta-barrel protein [Xanthobacteraceae bacterium]